MAGSLKTTFFKLVKYAANDITSWLTDFNGNMDKIDAAMNQNKTAAQTAQDGVDSLESEYETLLAVVNVNTTSIEANEKAIAANAENIRNLTDSLDNIEIGNQLAFNSGKGDATSADELVGSVGIYIQRVGKNVKLSGVVAINAGALHSYDRIGTGIINGRYCTDILRIVGNPANLEENVYSGGYGVLFGASDIYEPLNIYCVYLPESNYTAIGISVTTNTAINYSEAKSGILTI